MHYWTHGRIGDFVVKKPMILGHEGSGVVRLVGENVEGFDEGDRVALEPGVPCSHCPSCKDGRYNLCPCVKFAATPPVDGSLAYFTVHPASYCYKLPPTVSFDEAALFEPLSVGIHACRRGKITLGHKVLITGAGPIGLVCMLVAKASGASTVVIHDIDSDRLQVAKELGADQVHLTHMEADPKIVVEDVNADVCIDATGVESAVRTCIYGARRGGVVVLVGMGKPDISVPILEACIREVDLRGVFRYCNTYPTALQLVASGRVNVKRLVTHRFKMHDAEDAFKAAKDRSTKSIKVIIDCAPPVVSMTVPHAVAQPAPIPPTPTGPVAPVPPPPAPPPIPSPVAAVSAGIPVAMPVPSAALPVALSTVPTANGMSTIPIIQAPVAAATLTPSTPTEAIAAAAAAASAAAASAASLAAPLPMSVLPVTSAPIPSRTAGPIVNIIPHAVTPSAAAAAATAAAATAATTPVMVPSAAATTTPTAATSNITPTSAPAPLPASVPAAVSAPMPARAPARAPAPAAAPLAPAPVPAPVPSPVPVPAPAPASAPTTAPAPAPSTVSATPSVAATTVTSATHPTQMTASSTSTAPVQATSNSASVSPTVNSAVSGTSPTVQAATRIVPGSTAMPMGMMHVPFPSRGTTISSIPAQAAAAAAAAAEVAAAITLGQDLEGAETGGGTVVRTPNGAGTTAATAAGEIGEVPVSEPGPTAAAMSAAVSEAVSAATERWSTDGHQNEEDMDAAI